MSFIWFLIVGAIAGWLAGLVTKGKGYGLLGNIVLGILGGLAGGFAFGLLGISLGGGLIGSILTAAIGAVAVLALVRVIKKT